MNKHPVEGQVTCLRKRGLKDVKRRNRQVIIEAVLKNEGLSRVEIAQNTGLAASTVSSLVGELLAEGVLTEAGSVVTAGRSRTALTVNPAHGTIAVVEIGRRETLVTQFRIPVEEEYSLTYTVSNALALEDNPEARSSAHISVGNRVLARVTLEGREVPLRSSFCEELLPALRQEDETPEHHLLADLANLIVLLCTLFPLDAVFLSGPALPGENGLEYSQAVNLILSHEYYHFLEVNEIGLASRDYLVPMPVIGPLKLGKTGIRALSEVGAHAFVRRYHELVNEKEKQDEEA